MFLQKKEYLGGAVCGTVLPETLKAWAPRTQWNIVGSGTLTVKGVVDAKRRLHWYTVVENGEVIAMTTRGLPLALNGMEVVVHRRCSPLLYNGYYWEEQAWLVDGESLPPEYSEQPHANAISDALFGRQVDQAQAVGAFVPVTANG